MLFAGLGGALLSTAWLAGPARVELAHRIERFAARAEGRASHPFWHFDVDLDRLGGGWNWPATTTAELCTEVDVTGIPTGTIHTTLCGARRSQHAPWGILDTEALAPDAAVAWPPDARGWPEIEMRFSPRALAWLSGRKAFTWPLTGQSSEARAAMPPPGSELDAFLLEVDRPVEWLVRTWSAPPPAPYPMAYDPDDPNGAVPVSVLEAVRSRGPAWFMTGALALFGLVAWMAGIWIGFAGLSRPLFAAVAIGPLLALPWWGDRFAPALLWLEPRAGMVGADIAHDLNEGLRLPVEVRDPEALAGLQPVTWSIGRSYYDVLAGPFGPSLPDPKPADADAALAEASRQVSEKMVAASDAELAPLLARLRQDELIDRGEEGLLFLDGARRVALDETRAVAERKVAGSFLWWLSVTPLTPDPAAPAFQTRVSLWKTLLDFPDSAVANDAHDLVERATAPHR